MLLTLLICALSALVYGYRTWSARHNAEATVTRQADMVLHQMQTEAARPTNTPTSTFTPSPTSVPKAGSNVKSALDGMVMVFVPKGNFSVGNGKYPPLEPGEGPVHQVSLNAYWIDQTEVTNAVYALCGSCVPPIRTASSQQTNCYNDPQYTNFPMTNPCWNDASAWCKWAGRYLPPEAEWEKAAQITEGAIYPWGSSWPSYSIVNYSYCVGDVMAVANYPSGASLFR
jgi:formylglycine-generating enzyme required for sulfatase activity